MPMLVLLPTSIRCKWKITLTLSHQEITMINMKCCSMSTNKISLSRIFLNILDELSTSITTVLGYKIHKHSGSMVVQSHSDVIHKCHTRQLGRGCHVSSEILTLHASNEENSTSRPNMFDVLPLLCCFPPSLSTLDYFCMHP